MKSSSYYGYKISREDGMKAIDLSDEKANNTKKEWTKT